MFSTEYNRACEQVSDLARTHVKSLDSLQPLTVCDFAPLLWDEEFGTGGTSDREILARSAERKALLYRNQLFVIVPMYVTSICQEQCLYCNYRAGNKGIGVERKRLSIEELETEALYLIREKGFRVLELVYASDPQMRVDAMCRHVELLRRLLDTHGGGLVGISAEALEERDYRRLVNAGLCWSVLWQETYDKFRYAALHPGRSPKTNFAYRLDSYERMLAAGIAHVGVGVLSGLSDWRRDWAMLMLHEEYLRQKFPQGASILGTPRLKMAPGAAYQQSTYTPTRQDFLATIALHNLYLPNTAPFVSTREEWDVCLELARGGGCLFTLNCSTTPGGYSLHHEGCQFASQSFDAPVYAEKLRAEGFGPNFGWNTGDLRGNKGAYAAGAAGMTQAFSAPTS
jgi:2-iminoacetate synthase